MTADLILRALNAVTLAIGLLVAALSILAAIIAVITHKGNIRKFFPRVIFQAAAIFCISIVSPLMAEILTSDAGVDPTSNYVEARIVIYLLADAAILGLVIISVFVCRIKPKVLWSSQSAEIRPPSDQ